MQIDLHDAQTHLPRLIKRIQAGEEVILVKGGKPVTRLSPPDQAPGRVARPALIPPIDPERLTRLRKHRPPRLFG